MSDKTSVLGLTRTTLDSVYYREETNFGRIPRVESRFRCGSTTGSSGLL